MPDFKVQVLVDALNRAQAELNGVAQQIAQMDRAARTANTGGFAQARSGLTQITSVVRSLAPQIAAAFSAGAVLAFTRSVIDAAENIKNLSQEVGASFNATINFTNAAKLANVNGQQVATAFRTLAARIAEAQDAASPAAEIFQKLGFSQKDIQEGASNLDPILAGLAQRFAGWSEGANKVAIAQQLLGARNAALINVMNQGGGVFSAQTAEARANQTAMEALDAEWSKFEVALQRVQINGQTVTAMLATELLPALTEFVRQVADFSRSDAGLLGFATLQAVVQLVAAGVRIAALEFQKLTIQINGAVSAAGALKNWDLQGARREIAATGKQLMELTAEQLKVVGDLFDQDKKKAEDFAKTARDALKPQAPNIRPDSGRTQATTQAQFDLAMLQAKGAQLAAQSDLGGGNVSERVRNLEEQAAALREINEELAAQQALVAEGSEEWNKIAVQQAQNSAQEQTLLQQSRDLVREANARKLESTKTTLDDMATVTKAFGKKTFAAYKTFAIASATIDMYKAATSAFKSGQEVGGPYGAVARPSGTRTRRCRCSKEPRSASR